MDVRLVGNEDTDVAGTLDALSRAYVDVIFGHQKEKAELVVWFSNNQDSSIRYADARETVRKCQEAKEKVIAAAAVLAHRERVDRLNSIPVIGRVLGCAVDKMVAFKNQATFKHIALVAACIALAMIIKHVVAFIVEVLANEPEPEE